MLLALGALGAAHLLPLTPTDTILAASLADGPTSGSAGFVVTDKGASEYEADGDGTAARQALGTQLVETALSNHDSDGDGLIQITTVEQLNAVRYDLDGDGTVEDDDNTEGVDEAALYSAAFPVASDGSVCPDGTLCTGYELMNDLDLDTDGDGTAGDGDTYWNSGAGWQPIGVLNSGFAATFEGNGRSINNLLIDRSAEDHVGLFGLVGEDAEIRNIALVDISVTGSRYVGGLAGQLKASTVSSASTAGTVAGNRGRIGGLVGDGQNSIIEDSRSSATVTAMGSSGRAGGLVGELQGTGSEGGVKSVVRRSYATGTVSSDQSRVGGLVGNLYEQSTVPALVVASYATGQVSGSSNVGGLVGRSNGEVRASYATGAVNGNNKTGGLVGDNRGTVTTSYFDTDTSGQIDPTQGKTTSELQAPTGYETPADSIYAQWNVDLDGDDANDDPWDFGAGSQYPVLKVDGLDDDTTATWQEFGSQLRTRPVVSVSAAATSVTLNWTAPAQTDYPGAPTITYQVYRDGSPIGAAQAGVTYTDEGLAGGFTHVYRVDVLMDGERVRGSNAAVAPPTLSISIADAEAVEGSDASFTVTKTGTGAVSLNWTTSIGESDTATSADLGPTTSGTVAFNASDASKTFTVETVQDAMDEIDETFAVTLTVASGPASLSVPTAAGAITDDDESAGAPTGLTASTGSGEGEIDLAWTAPLDTGILNGADPAAITGYQYRQSESSAGLASAVWNSAGNTTAFIVTDLTGGTTYHFQVRALNGVTPGGAVSNDASATTGALSSDANLSSLAISQGTLSPDLTTAETAYTATVDNSVQSLTVTPTAVDGSAAIAVNDAAATSGSASEAIALTVGANTIQVVVTAEDGTKATYTITATRAGPSISIADAEGAEGGNVTFTVTKTGTGAVSLDWTASIGESDTAAIADLGATTSGTVAFTASDTSKSFSVAAAQDAVDEDNETFTVTLTATSGTPIVTDGTATGTITDDDKSAGAPTGLTASTGSGEGEIDLEWTAPSDTGVLNGIDPASVTGYQYRSAQSSTGLPSATWADAGTAATFAVTGLTGGSTYYFQVRALNGVTPEGAASNEASATAKALPGISIADAAGAEGGSVTFTVTKTGTEAVSLNWTASIGESDTAAIADLGPTTSGAVEFAASDTTKTFAMATAQDAVDEDNETFTVTLSPMSGTPNVTDGTATGTITDDDKSAGAPTGLTASTGSGEGEIDLSWIAPSDTGVLNGIDPASITGYQYRRAESSLGLDSAAWTAAETTTIFTVSDLTAGTIYYFQVRALNGVTPEGTASNEDSATAKALSSNANLVSLEISQGTLLPDFATAETAYTATVDNGVESLNVTPTAADSNATIAVNDSTVTSSSASGAIPLDIGANVIEVSVTAEDRTVNRYTITVTRTGPTISVTDAAGGEGGNVTFTVSKLGVGAVALNWTASIEESDTAAIADLGTTTSGAVEFAASDTTKTFTVAAAQDAVDEDDETFTVTLTVTAGLPKVTNGTATGTITDDDKSAGVPTGLTASTGSGEGEIDLEWIAPSDPGVLNGTDPAAITGYQYRQAESNAGLVSAAWDAAGNTTAFTVTGLTGGTTYHFQVRALNGVTPGGAVSNDASATTGALSSDANLSSLAISQGTLSPEFAAAKTAYTATVDNNVDSLTVTPTAADSNATIAVNDSAVASGSASEAIALTVGANTIQVVVTAEDGTKATYTVTATRAGPSIPISIADAEGAEGGNLSFTVTKTGAGAVSLNWTASIGESDTAAITDLGATTSGTVDVAASDTDKSFSVATAQDAVDEDNETFTVTLSATAGMPNVTDGTATGTITDDDESAGAPTGLTASTGSGEGEIDLAWTAPSDTGILNGADPAAITGYQYRQSESSAGLASAVWNSAGNTTAFIVTDLTGGTTYYFQVRALNGVTPEGEVSAKDSAAAKALPGISIADAGGLEGGNVSFTVTKTGAGAVSLNWTASIEESDTAAIADLGTTTSGAVEFAASDTTKTFIVAATQDAMDENDETFTVTLSPTTGMPNLADGTATGTITDDDQVPGAPTGLMASTGSGEGEIDLSWTAPSDTGVLNGTDPAAITGYQYRQSESSAGLASAVWNSAGNTTAFTVTDLTGGTTFHFQVRALNGVTPGGAASIEDSATTSALSSDANLSALVISQGTLSPEFAAAKTAYTAAVANSVASLAVTPTAADSNATIAVNDSAVASGSSSEAIALTIGANIIKVVVTAEDGTKKTYTIAVTRAGPSISIADAEGAEGGNVSFTVTKTGTGSVSLNWTASIEESDTTATADLDTTMSGAVEFAASDTSKTFTVAAAQDAVDENDETFTVTLSATAGMPNVTDGTATGTITDDDESAGAPTGLTASTGSGEGEIDLAWTPPSDTGVLNGADPAAITGYQYRRAESNTGLVSAAWTAAETTTNFTVTGLAGGTTYHFQVRALNGVTPGGAVSNDASATTGALSSDANLSSLAISQGTLSLDFTTAETAYTATVDNSVASLAVTPTAADGSATIAVNNSTVTSGSASGAIPLDIGANVIEVSVTAEDGTKKTYTITATRAGPSISIADAEGAEGGNVTFTVTKTGTGAVSLDWTASIGQPDTAAIADLGATTSGTVAFTASDTTKTFTVAAAQDAVDEDNETFTVTLTATAGMPEVTDGTAAGTITDDDETVGSPAGLTAYTGSSEGEIDLAWTAPSDTGVLNGADPAAITGYQYRRAQSSVGLPSATWADAGTVATFTVTGLTAGTTYYFQVRALNGVTPEGAASNEASAAAKALPGISIADAEGAEGGNLSFTVTKTGTGSVSLNWTASVGESDTADTADLGATTSGAVEFAASDTAKTFAMAAAQDAVDEDNETFTVTLTATSGTPIVTDGTATGTITDDDKSAGAPTGLTASTGSGEGEIDLAWTAPLDTGILNGADPAPITGYQYRLAESSGGLPSAPWTTAGTVTNRTITGLTGGTTYYFQVRALNGVTPEGEVSAEDSATTRALSSDANLSSLATSQGTLSPEFAAAKTAYTATVDNNVDSLTVTPTAADSNATIAVNDSAVASGSPSEAIALTIGLNIIKVVVTAEDGTKKTYTITVTRAGPSISIADAVGAEGGNLSFTVTKTGTGSVSLNWTTSIGESDTAAIADLGTTTSGLVSFAASDTAKTFTVETVQDAVDEHDETFTVTLSPMSGTPNVTDGTAMGIITDDDESADAPTGLTAATGSGEGEIDLSWTAPSDTGVLNGADQAAITGYQVRQSESSTGLDSAAWNNAGNTTTLTVTGLVGGTTYYFQVRALNGVTPEGAASNKAGATAKATSSNANLSGLEISLGTLSPGFTPQDTDYTVTVANRVTSIIVTPTAADSSATIAVNGTAAASGSPSGPILLRVGDNATGVTVTAEDGTEKKYTITVGRAAPSSYFTDPPVPSVSAAIADAIGIEGGDITFTVNKKGAGAVSLNWTVSIEGSDTAGTEDLGAPASGTVSFNASENSETFTVATSQDALDEDDETFTVILTVTSGKAKVADGTATGTITDDDQAAGAPIGLTASPGSGEGEVDLSWNKPSNTGVLNGADPAPVTGYQYRLAESSGALPSALWTTAGTATHLTATGLTAGTTYYFQVRALNGVTPEGEKSGEAGAAARELPAISINDATGVEGSGVSFTASKTGAGAVTLHWTASIGQSDTAATVDLGATTSGSVDFADSDTNKTFTVATVQDSIDESAETFTMTLATASGEANVADGTATGTITDDDESAGAPIGLIASAGAGEGEIDMLWSKPPDTGVLNGTSPPAVTGYQYRQAESSTGLPSATWADAGTATTYTVTSLTAGTTYYFQVRALNGVTPEGEASDEASAGAEALPAVSIDDATGVEGSGVSFTASKTGAGAVTLHWTASIGQSDTAATVDLGATTSGSVDFADSDTNKTFTVATVQDSMDESAETFTVTVSAAPGSANVADGTATGTIADDDASAGVPTGLTAAPGDGEGEIDLAWAAPFDTGVLNGADPAAVTGYQYRLSQSSGGLASAPWTTAGPTTHYTVSGLAEGTAYYFQVRALNGVTPESAASAEATGAPVDPGLDQPTGTPAPTLTPEPNEGADEATGGSATVPNADDDPQPPSGTNGEPEQTPVPTPTPTPSITPTPSPTFAPTPTPQPTAIPTAAPAPTPDRQPEPASTSTPAAKALPTATFAPTAAPSPSVVAPTPEQAFGEQEDTNLPVWAWLVIGIAALATVAAGAYALNGNGGGRNR